MLRDPESPRSQAIFAAARHLTALDRLWSASEFASSSEVDARIDCLRDLARTHFSESKEIAVWLDELSILVKADLAAKSTYADLVDRLYGVKGFCRVCV